MKLVTWITTPLIAYVCWAGAVGCSEDETSNPGGSGGKAGAGGSAGTSGTAGKGGTGGSAGSAGRDAAAETGGDGALQSDAPDGGVAKQCLEECIHDDDCSIPGSDAAAADKYACREKRCVKADTFCVADGNCLASTSQWNQECDASNACKQIDQVCIDIGAGQGRCARRALPVDAGIDGGARCIFFVPDVISMPVLDDSGSVEVCADKRGRCNLETKTCYSPCESSNDCVFPGGGSSCDTDTGLCRCVKDDDCKAPGVSKCNLTSGRCECASDDDCKAVPEHKLCVSGQCGCSGSSQCQKTFSGTTPTCK